MRHLAADDLERIQPLLAELRAADGLIEKKPAVFYRKSKAFLHFHVDGDDVFADVRLDAGEFMRMRVTTAREQAALVHAVRSSTGSIS